MDIDVYKADDNFVTSGSDLYLQKTYRAIDSVASGTYLLYSVLKVIRDTCHAPKQNNKNIYKTAA